MIDQPKDAGGDYTLEPAPAPPVAVARPGVSQSGASKTPPVARVKATPPRPAGLPIWELLVFLALACATPLGYEFYTRHIWEDSFINLRHSENLVRGEGLVFNPGERVHGFTSPLNILLVALGYVVTGATTYMAPLWFYFGLCVIAYAAGGALLMQTLYRLAPARPLSRWLFAAIYLFDVKSVAYTANGMETAFMLLFLAGCLCLMASEDASRWILRGVCWAGLMWTRPDGFIYIGVLSAAEWLFSPGDRLNRLVSFIKGGLVCAVLYAPWFAWAWNYYGSPVPHTVTAKGDLARGGLGHLLLLLEHPRDVFQLFFIKAFLLFRPINYQIGGAWLQTPALQYLVSGLTAAVSVFCMFYWLAPVKDRLGRAASLSFFVICFYFTYMPSVACWYMPPLALLGMVAIARAAITLPEAWVAWTGAKSRAVPRLALAVAGILAAGQMALFGMTTYEMKVQQEEIENGNRMQIGLWLREHGLPNESVYLEPLGYIGYFSNMRMMDFPGLVAPEVVQARRDNPTLNMVELIPILKPDWIVLRPLEMRMLVHDKQLTEEFTRDYELAQQFNARDRLEEYSFIPGRLYVEYDSEYAIFRKRSLRPNSTQ